MGEWKGPEDNRHTLTPEEAQRGRENITEKRRVSCAINPLKHGQYSKSGLVPDEFLNCDSCRHRKACSFYRKGQECRIQGTEALKQLVQLHSADAIELLQTINREILSYAVKVKGSDRLADQNAWIKLLLEFYRLRFGSRELIMQVSKNLSDEEFESLIEIYQKKVLAVEPRENNRASESDV